MTSTSDDRYSEFAAEVVIEAFPEPTLLLTLNGEVVGANKPAQRLFRDRERLIGRSIRTLFHNELDQVGDALSLWRGSGEPIPVRLTFDDANGAGGPRRCEGWRASGAAREHVLVRVVEVDFAAEKLTELTELIDHLNRECTKRAEIELQLRSLLVQLNTQNSVRDHILAQVSHDLRTPLNAVIGMTDLMLHEPFGRLQPRYLDYLHDIHYSGRTLLELVEKVMTLAVAAGEETQASELAADLTSCLEGCYRVVAPLATMKGVRILMPDSMQLPQIRADQMLLKQVIMNLLSNAVKHGDDQTKVEVRAERFEDGGLRLEVADDGPGMTADVLDRALNSAERNPYVANAGGGVGLYLTKRSADAVGARLSIESVVGAGTVAGLEFPSSIVI